MNRSVTGGSGIIHKDKKLKIAIFHCGFIYTGGGERIVIEEILGLRKQGYQVDCFVPIYDPTLSYPDIIKNLKIRTFLPQLPRFVPFRFALQMVGSCFLSCFLVTRFSKYDIILGANQPGAFIAWVIAGILRKPYFVYLSQPNRILYPRNNEDWQNVKDYYYLSKIINNFFKPVVSFLDRKSITRGKNLFINGSFVAKEICQIYQPKSWIDCPGGAHLASKKALKNNRYKGEIRVNHSKFEKPYALFTSRHEPWKRFDLAIEAIAKVIKKCPEAKLVVPGTETTITPKLKELARKLGIFANVIFTGPINQQSLWRLYENAVVYIFTSQEEDLGIVVEEAQAAGVPVVAWNTGGPTVTVVNNKTGFLVKPYDLSMLADKITYLFENPHRKDEMGRNAWEHMKNNFSWERHIGILENEFMKIKKK